MKNKFGERLKELREEAGLTQTELEKETGLTRSAIGLWELGKREPKLGAVIVLANFFNVTLGYMAGIEN